MPYMSQFDQKLGRGIAFCLLYFSLCHRVLSAQPLFARFSTDRTPLYVGEAFQITMAIHATAETLDKQISLEALPSPDDLHLDPFEELPLENVTIDSRSYEVRKFRAWARANRSGPISLAPRLGGTLIQTTRSFFFIQQNRRPIGIPVEPATLSILPLPQTGRPADFSGLVGRYTFSVSPAPLEIAPRDLITVAFMIEGDVFPNGYQKPEMKPVKGLKTYEVKAVAAESTPTRHVFNQTVIPVDATVTTLPSCSLCFFDSRDARYKILTAGPFPIRYHTERTPVQTIYTPTPSLSTAGISPAINTPDIPPRRGESIGSRLRHWIRHERSADISGTTAVQVYLAPSETSMKLFTLKPGTPISFGASGEGWIRVSSPDGIGWIPETAVEPVSP